jgi:hypothetical protein
MTTNPAENSEVTRFLKEHKSDMPVLYKSYDWEGDIWKADYGFPNLFELECEISKAARENKFNTENLLHIAEWGKLPNKTGIRRVDQFKITLYLNNKPAFWLKEEPENAICIVEGRIPGFGPTYSSKLLHFAIPEIFGALDTWLVRTFGKGDHNSHHYEFLDLRATQSPTGRWSIPSKQRGWPDEYGTWIRILNYFADILNNEKIPCPHPSNYLKAGLRTKDTWLPADVETALFSYAYEGRGLKN